MLGCGTWQATPMIPQGLGDDGTWGGGEMSATHFLFCFVPSVSVQEHALRFSNACCFQYPPRSWVSFLFYFFTASWEPWVPPWLDYNDTQNDLMRKEGEGSAHLALQESNIIEGLFCFS